MAGKIDLSQFAWANLQPLSNRSFVCGFCGVHVSSTLGLGLNLQSGHFAGGIYICPNCRGPNFIVRERPQYPSPSLGKPVEHVPDDLNTLYEEARRCTSEACYTAAVLLCRKMLMNIAVQLEATEGKSFIEYVKYLSDKGYVPPNGKHWVNHIRNKGNEANHEIALMEEAEAKNLGIIPFTYVRYLVNSCRYFNAV